jgi:hypothetical protein
LINDSESGSLFEIFEERRHSIIERSVVVVEHNVCKDHFLVVTAEVDGDEEEEY